MHTTVAVIQTVTKYCYNIYEYISIATNVRVMLIISNYIYIRIYIIYNIYKCYDKYDIVDDILLNDILINLPI